MSGLVAIVDWECPGAGEALLRQALARAPHRAGEGQAVRAGDHCALGLDRQATTPSERQQEQPVYDAGRGLWIVADARLDNREELQPLLFGSGAPARSVTELLLTGYEHWGLQLAEHLVGDFAFVIWDSNHQHLYAVRDPFGVRPLFYHAQAARLFLASEVEQILRCPGVAWEVNERTILDYLLGDPRQIRETFFRRICRIPPGHYLLATRQALRETRYWHPPVAATRRRGEGGTRRPAGEDPGPEFRRLFRRAVAALLDTDRPLLALLSGGLDSSALVCMAADIYRKEGTGRPPLLLASAVFPGLDCDETPFIDAVARWTGFPSERWDGTIWQEDEPSILPLAEPSGGYHRALFAALEPLVQRTGARVILSGHGGDELLYERGVFRDLAARGWWLQLVREAARVAPASPQTMRWFIQDAFRGAAPCWLRQAYRRLRPRQTPPPPPWLGPRLVSLWAEASPGQAGAGPEVPEAWASHTQEWTWRWLTNPRSAWLTERWQREAAGRQLEFRFPFFDAPLARGVLTIPFEQRLPGGRMKRLLRQALADLLPPAVASRRRVTSFNTSFWRFGQRHLPAWHALVHAGSDWASAPYVDRRAAQQLLSAVAASSPGAAGVERLRLAFHMVMLERWLRRLAGCPTPQGS